MVRWSGQYFDHTGFSPEAIAIEVDHRLRGEHAVEVLNRPVRKRGAPN